MIDFFDSHISMETLFWLFPITFLIHDFEEIIFVESWFKRNYAKVVHKIPEHMKKTFDEMAETTAARFSIPVFMQFVFYIVATYLAVEKGFLGPFIGFNVVFFLHIFMHIGQSLFLRTYALGVGTAVLVTLPYSLYLFDRLLDKKLIEFSDFVNNLPYGIIPALILMYGHRFAAKVLP